MKKRYLCVVVLLLSLLFMGIQPALGQGSPTVGSEEPPLPPEDPHIPGTLEGTGTYFALEDSEYLNITLESTEPVHLRLESVPEMVVMHLEAAGGASSAVISLGGFPPSTTFYKYEDDYHNEVAFTTDDNGAYTYTQDLSQPHFIFIQPGAGTKFIRDDATGGDCGSIGTWDSATKTCTLTIDVYQTIYMVDDNLTLDGSEQLIAGPGFGCGVYLHSRTGITIENVSARDFTTGMCLYYSSNNTLTGNTATNNSHAGIHLHSSTINALTGNTVSNNDQGIRLSSSSHNTLTGNTAESSNYHGIVLYSSTNNALTGNTVSSNDLGIYLLDSSNNTLGDNMAFSNSHHGVWLHRYSSNNTLTGNTVSNNQTGIQLSYNSNNTLTGNTAESSNGNGIILSSSNNNTLLSNTASNNGTGICLHLSSENTLTGNTAASNNHRGINVLYFSDDNSLTDNSVSNNNRGIYVHSCSGNQVYNNNFIANSIQAYVYGGEGNIFNLPAPTGGNYWSDWTSPDENPADGFVDYPYVFMGGQDNLPWTMEDGWLVDTTGPTTSDVMADPNPASMNTVINLTATVDDSTTGNSSVASAEYSLDDGMTWHSMAAADSTFDSPSEVVVGSTSLPEPGVYELCVRGTDTEGNIGLEECIFLVVYDPEGGFVTGGGWIDSPAGAYTADPSLAGKATFGFVSEYKKGASVPTGQTEFQFHVADLNFHSTAYEWLVVNQGATNAQFKGSGTINRETAPSGNHYRFMLWAGDDQPDTFRMKIWWEDGDTEHLVYDNGFEQPIGGGSIVIHQGLMACIPSLISPEEGAVLDNGRTDRLDDIVWDFDWSECPGATKYHLYVIRSAAPSPVGPVIDDDNINHSSYHWVCQGCYIADQNRLGWTWKVRAKVGGQWGEWSEMRTFDVEPVNTDPASP